MIDAHGTSYYARCGSVWSRASDDESSTRPSPRVNPLAPCPRPRPLRGPRHAPGGPCRLLRPNLASQRPKRSNPSLSLTSSGHRKTRLEKPRRLRAARGEGYARLGACLRPGPRGGRAGPGRGRAAGGMGGGPGSISATVDGVARVSISPAMMDRHVWNPMIRVRGCFWTSRHNPK